MENSSEDKVLAGLSHLAIFLNLIGILGVLIVYLVKKDESEFIAHHAKQALGYQVVIMVITWLLGIFFAAAAVGGALTGQIFELEFLVPGIMILAFLFGLLAILITIALYGYAIYAAVKAFQGEDFVYAVIGKLLV